VLARRQIKDRTYYALVKHIPKEVTDELCRDVDICKATLILADADPEKIQNAIEKIKKVGAIVKLMYEDIAKLGIATTKQEVDESLKNMLAKIKMVEEEIDKIVEILQYA